jgi:peptide chain release factor 1
MRRSALLTAALSAGAQAWMAAPRTTLWGTAAASRAPACIMVDAFVLDRLREMRGVHDDLTAQLEDPSVQANVDAMLRVTRERAKLDGVVQALNAYESCEQRLKEAKELFSEDDAELREMARAEIKEAEDEMEALDSRMKVLLLPSDPNDDRNVMFEIRAGTGGDEAAIWASDLLNLYERYAREQGWQTRLVSRSDSEAGGMRDATIEIKGQSVYSKLKFEAGVHRVQRVPATETQGRIHTSTATVAIMPEVDEVIGRTRLRLTHSHTPRPCHFSAPPHQRFTR